jgi:uncharacterized protein with GYD domain
MIRYLSLLTFTEQGIADVKASVKRAAMFRSSVETAGGQVIAQYWAVGEADGCLVFEAPDEPTAAALLLGLAREGNVRTKSMRVYDADEFGKTLLQF